MMSFIKTIFTNQTNLL